ncbi:stringent starvation protein B [Oceanospirillum multiglobuliferum]|uniref:ClpXP protease specificity-enhancing factor n=1 Tax=Oceanospirillum multiglobuliferum TaxID=64969 RepID=A0A1T4KRU1_9GAMM|nr:ClpXP protease specificity-enhancing factor [Oceanospirillum multiglobuliferum]OPX56123.1 ClpXP protease specificity-enhancing factor [Oceanospirillum multiglobuliferum]SJZ45141.1 stringent starvation protein B [Oceanospirillum multiglobuliferum]
MSTSRPYLVRGLYEWLVDHSMTPYIAVDATLQDVMVPSQHVHDGQIVLNISMSAVHDLLISNDAVSFSARFGGVPQQVYIPILAVMAIYAKENGQGMVFGQEPDLPDPEDDDFSADSIGEGANKAPAKESASKRPALRVVK